MSEVEFTVGKQAFKLSSRPKHKDVKAIRNILTGWLLDRIDLSEIKGSKSISLEDALQKVILSDPRMALEVEDIESTLLSDQTIILATGLSYKELTTVKDDMYEDEYIELFDKCVEVLGGDANSFFVRYGSKSTSRSTKKSKK